MKNIFIKLFLMLVVIIFSSVQVFAENIRFIQVADAHLDVNSDFSKKILKSAIKDINSQQDIAFVVFSGDNVNSPKAANVKEFAQIAKGLNVPYYVVLGNHDVYKNNGLSKSKYYDILKSKNIFFKQRSSNYKFSKGSFVFLLVDGSKEVMPNQSGYYRKETLEWLDSELTKAKDNNVVILQHFPIVYPKGSEPQLDTHKTYKVEDYKKVISDHDNVLAVITGHFHVDDQNMSNGIYHISTSSVLTVPYSYKVIDIVLTKDFSPIIYTQLKEFKLDEN